MATPDFPQERLVHDAFGYVGFLLAEVLAFARWQGVFVPFFEGRKQKTETLLNFFYTLKNRGHSFKLYFPFGGVNQTIYMSWLNFRDFP